MPSGVNRINQLRLYIGDLRQRAPSDLPGRAASETIGAMDRAPPDFEWSHVLPSGKIVTNLTATRDELLQVLRDVKADAAERLADAHHRTIQARDLWVQQRVRAGKWPRA